MHRLFLSDLHLEAPDTPAYMRFAECLQQEAKRVDELYLLGDVVEMWIGDDDDSLLATSLADSLAQASNHCQLFLMHGNRDFLFGDQFCHAANTTLLTEPHLTDDGILLCHGDALCTDDTQYQQMRALLRSEPWQADILSKSLEERKAFGQGLRAQSKDSNANKPSNIMDVNKEATQALMQEQHAHTLIHGHTHRPGIHQHDTFTRIVTGAWEGCGWVARQENQQVQLECFSLAHRYEI